MFLLNKYEQRKAAAVDRIANAAEDLSGTSFPALLDEIRKEHKPLVRLLGGREALESATGVVGGSGAGMAAGAGIGFVGKQFEGFERACEDVSNWLVANDVLPGDVSTVGLSVATGMLLLVTFGGLFAQRRGMLRGGELSNELLNIVRERLTHERLDKGSVPAKAHELVERYDGHVKFQCFNLHLMDAIHIGKPIFYAGIAVTAIFGGAGAVGLAKLSLWATPIGIAIICANTLGKPSLAQKASATVKQTLALKD